MGRGKKEERVKGEEGGQGQVGWSGVCASACSVYLAVTSSCTALFPSNQSSHARPGFGCGERTCTVTERNRERGEKAAHLKSRVW